MKGKSSRRCCGQRRDSIRADGQCPKLEKKEWPPTAHGFRLESSERARRATRITTSERTAHFSVQQDEDVIFLLVNCLGILDRKSMFETCGRHLRVLAFPSGSILFFIQRYKPIRSTSLLIGFASMSQWYRKMGYKFMSISKIHC